MQGFNEWLARHTKLFAMFDPKIKPMLGEWQALFDACGFSVAELGEATTYLVTNGPPDFPSQHPSALIARVRYCRARAAQSAQDDSPDVPRCALCGGGGFASVPDLAGVVAGEWVGVRAGGGAWHRTCAVTCSCYKGRQLNPLGRDERRLCGSLAAYELANPHWRAQAAQLHHERLAEARAELAHAHGPLAELMRRLLAGAGDPGRREDAA